MSLILDGTAGVTGPATKVIVGTTTNDSATAGYVGEVISSTVDVTVGVSLTTSTAKTVTSISLTAGDWDITGMVSFNGNGATTVTLTAGGINTTTNTLPAAYEARATAVFAAASTPFATSPIGSVVPTVRAQLTTTTTYYLVAVLNFGISTAGAGGTIYARRVR